MDSSDEQELVLDTEAGPEPSAPAPRSMGMPPSPNLSGPTVDLRGRYSIFTDQPLPHLNSPNAVAFACQMKTDMSRPLFALLGHPDLPPRVDAMEQMRGVTLAGLMKIVDWGMVDWTPEKRRRFVVVFDRPGGQRVMPSLDVAQAPLQEEEIVAGLLTPLLNPLKELGGRAVCHRAIRPDNLFYSDIGRRGMVLGECVSSPPAFDQPALFETIESAMSHPTGRGVGTQANDMYSLGVTILFLVLGRSPVGDLDSDRLLANKIEFGSYAALVGQQRVPLNLTEPLRGLLTDDPRERWTVMDLDMWLSGRRLSPKQPKLPPRSSRPFVFQEVEYFNTRALAFAFAKDHRAAITQVRGKALDAWLRRSLNDETRADALQNAVSSTASHIASGRGGEDRLVARACISLDPSAPIRYRGFGVMIGGVGPALSAAMNNRERRQIVSEIIASRLPIHWVAAQGKPGPEDLRAVQILEKLPSIIDQAAIGFGVERCLYELNPGERCHSPLFERDFVTDISQVTSALEVVARRQDRPDSPLDRHIVAFIAARARRINDDVLRSLANPDFETRSLAMLRMLASIQDQTNSPPTPALAQWCAQILAPIVTSYHHRRRRDRIADRVARVASDGSLSDLLSVIDDDGERAADRLGFNEASAEYRQLDYELRSFEAEKIKREDDARTLGEQIAAAVGGVLVSLTTAVAFLIVLAR